MNGVSSLSSPIFFILLTLSLYTISDTIYKRVKTPLIHPVFITMVFLILILLIFNIPYEKYMKGGQIISFFLGPSVVALAVPLYKERKRIAENLAALSITVPFGSLVGILSALIPGRLYGLSPEVMISLAPKSATTPIAMGIAASLGGLPDLTAAVVVFTGLFGVITGPILLKLLGLVEDAVFGFALGFACHGIGTAKALERSETAGAYSGLALGLNGLATALLTPLLFNLLF